MLSAVISQPLGLAGWQQTLAAAPTASSSTGPTIKFLRPMKNELFSDVPIYIQVCVDKFKLVAPDQIGEQAGSGTGFIDYSLDDFPVLCTDSTQLMLGKNLGRGYIPVGKHVLRAQLVDINDHPLQPPVIAETFVWSTHPASRETSSSSPGSTVADPEQDELRKVQLHLQQVQRELYRIQSGTSGYQPTPMLNNRNATTPGE